MNDNYNYATIDENVPLSELTQDHISFEWIELENRIHHLIKGRKLIEDDGNYFIDLKKAIEDKIITLDPKRTFDKDKMQYVSPEEKETEVDALKNFMGEMAQLDRKKEQAKDNKIFDENINKIANKHDIDEATRKRQGDAEKMKGNEALKSGDVNEAIEHYTLALKFDPTNAIILSNRAAAYLKIKNWKAVLIDSNKAISYDPNYMKAYYRRAKALSEMKNYKQAARDYKLLMSKMPDDKDVVSCYEATLKLLTSSEKEELEFEIVGEDKKEDTPNSNDHGFKRIEIEEDSDEEEEEDVPAGGNNKELVDKLDFLESKKVEGVALVKEALYEKAIKTFETAINSFCLEEFVYIDKELKERAYKLRSGLWSNIGFSNMQLDMPKRVIRACDEVIETVALSKKVNLTEDRALLEKTYLRRALQYQKLDVLEKALADYKSVKQYNPGNLKASEGIRSCTMQLGIDKTGKFVPETKPKEPVKKPAEPVKKPDSPKKKPASPEKKPEPKQNIPKEEPKIKNDYKVDSTMEEKSADYVSEFEIRKIEQKKEEGSNHYKLGKIDQAFKSFSDGIRMIEESHPNAMKDLQGYNKKLSDQYLALLGNRALLASMLKKYSEGKDDANKVILIDPKNMKAYYRRVLNLKGLTEDLEERLSTIKDTKLFLDLKQKQLEYQNQGLLDCDSILKDDTTNQATTLMKDKLTSLKASSEIVISAKKEELEKEKEQANKESKPVEGNSQKEAELKKIREEQKKNLAKEINEQTADITNKALDNIIESKDLPNTAQCFEIQFNSFKENYGKLWQFIKKFDSKQITVLYSKREMESKIFIKFIRCFAKVCDDENSTKISEYLLALSKAKSAKLTAKFLVKKEKQELRECIEKLEKNTECVKTINEFRPILLPK